MSITSLKTTWLALPYLMNFLTMQITNKNNVQQTVTRFLYFLDNILLIRKTPSISLQVVL